MVRKDICLKNNLSINVNPFLILQQKINWIAFNVNCIVHITYTAYNTCHNSAQNSITNKSWKQKVSFVQRSIFNFVYMMSLLIDDVRIFFLRLIHHLDFCILLQSKINSKSEQKGFEKQCCKVRKRAQRAQPNFLSHFFSFNSMFVKNLKFCLNILWKFPKLAHLKLKLKCDLKC